MTEERSIIFQILEVFSTATGIKVSWVSKDSTRSASIDGILRLKLAKRQVSFPVQAKMNIYTPHLPGLMELQRYNEGLLVFASHIQPKVRKELKETGINYMDAAGNVFIQSDDIFILIEAKKPKDAPETMKVQPFNKTGLKIVFQILNNENLINGTIRQIAARGDVSLDSVHKTIGGLKQAGYLVPLNSKTLAWNKKQELLEKWMAEYDTRLKPGLHIANFRFIKEEYFYNWKDLQFENGRTCWGAEPAGELLTGYLKPEVLTIYTNESKPDLIRQYRLVPDPKGYIKAYEKFWNQDDFHKDIAPPLLVYTDLINTGNKRNLETAQKVYEQFLQNKF